jgi:hypothetical protein
MLSHPKTPQQLLTKVYVETQPLSCAVRYRESVDQSKENAAHTIHTTQNNQNGQRQTAKTAEDVLETCLAYVHICYRHDYSQKKFTSESTGCIHVQACAHTRTRARARTHTVPTNTK